MNVSPDFFGNGLEYFFPNFVGQRMRRMGFEFLFVVVVVAENVGRLRMTTRSVQLVLSSDSKQKKC